MADGTAPMDLLANFDGRRGSYGGRYGSYCIQIVSEESRRSRSHLFLRCSPRSCRVCVARQGVFRSERHHLLQRVRHPVSACTFPRARTTRRRRAAVRRALGPPRGFRTLRATSRRVLRMVLRGTRCLRRRPGRPCVKGVPRTLAAHVEERPTARRGISRRRNPPH